MGKTTIVENDHKPLENINKKPLADTPPRLQRMMLRIQKYDYEIKYRPGKEMIVCDMLSRASIIDYLYTGCMDREVDLFVHGVVSELPVSEEKLTLIKNEYQIDPVMIKLKETIQKGWPKYISNAPRERDTRILECQK